jgi:hypothetical protein
MKDYADLLHTRYSANQAINVLKVASSVVRSCRSIEGMPLRESTEVLISSRQNELFPSPMMKVDLFEVC